MSTPKAHILRIYILRDPFTDEVRYVGITSVALEERLRGHKRAAATGERYSCRWIRLLLERGAVPLIEEVEQTTDPAREAFWIEHFRLAGCRLTNHHAGGAAGWHHDERARARIAEAGTTRYKDLTGRQFGRLTVKELHGHKPVRWLCECSCGNTSIVEASHFWNGNTQSCGCLSRDLASERARARARHGMWKTKEYLTWIEMRARCNNPRHARYNCNGAMGVQVCEQWQLSFEQFLADMGAKPTNSVLIRRDPTQGYSSGNCFWGTRSQLRSQKNR